MIERKQKINNAAGVLQEDRQADKINLGEGLEENS